MSDLLIVDDDRELCRLMEMLLRYEGHRATSVTDGPSALRFLEGKTPELVLLDIMMPGLDGMQVLRQIRLDPRLHDLKVVMYTAVSDQLKQAEAEGLGAVGYVVKGAPWGDMYSQIARHLEH